MKIQFIKIPEKFVPEMNKDLLMVSNPEWKLPSVFTGLKIMHSVIQFIMPQE